MAYPTLLLESAHRGADPAVVDRDAIFLSVMHFSEAGAKFLFGDLIFNNVPVGTGASEGNGSVVLSERWPPPGASLCRRRSCRSRRCWPLPSCSTRNATPSRLRALLP